MSDEAVVDAGTEGTGEGQAQETPAFDLGPIEARMSELETGIRDDLAAMREQFAPPEQDGLESDEQWPWETDEDDGALEITPEQLQQMIDQRAQQALTPVQQQMREMQYRQLAAGVEERHPELRDKGTAEKVIDEAFRRAAALGLPEEAVQNPLFLEQTWEAMEYRRLSQEIDKSTGTSQSDGLESAGARPGGDGPSAEDQYADRILNKESRSLGF